jgi:hypothetical protein
MHTRTQLNSTDSDTAPMPTDGSVYYTLVCTSVRVPAMIDILLDVNGTK